MALKSNHLLFLESLQKGLAKIQEQKPGIIVVWGPCEYFVFKALKAIKTVWQNKTSSPTFSWEGEDLKKHAFLELCEQRNLFESASLHIIKRLKKQAEFSQWLLSLTSTPQNILILSLETDKLAKKFSDAMGALEALIIPCQKPSHDDIPKIALQLLKNRKLNLSPESLKILLQAVTNDLYALENEIERLSLVFTDEKPVTPLQLAPFLHTIPEEQGFRLISLIVEEKHTQAQLFVTDLLHQGESPIGITSLIAWHCRNTLKLMDAARNSGKSNPLRVSYPLLKSYQKYVRSIKPRQMACALVECQSVDASLKSSSLAPEILLSHLLSMLS